ncbi:hypothetical protein OHB25_59400 [Streptomyces mirabilis]|uniref:hypothetical protein n=1 Tax=Streptomyces mirabilis TaxID=68239 RepID=UPI002E233124
MERLELVVVQLEEAKRLIATGRAPHLRLAFILLDNAVEVMLHRLVQQALQFNDMQAGLLHKLRELEQAGVDDEELRELIAQTQSAVVSERDVRTLEHVFDEKALFLVRRGLLSQELAPVLKKLHQYRNETYHRDRRRPEILDPAVRIYFDVACTVLESYSPFSLTYSSTFSPGPELERFTGARPTPLAGHLPKTVAAQLRAELDLDPAGVRSALSSYLLARLDSVDERLVSVDALPWLVAGDALRLAQLPRDRPVDLEKSRSRPGTHRPADLVRWRTRAEALAVSEADKHAIFTEFAAIEDEFEELETLIHMAADQIEDGVEEGLRQVAELAQCEDFEQGAQG